MTKSLRVLLVEDNEDDALLLSRELRRAGYALAMERVEDEPLFRQHLGQEGWDIVIADYTLPRFSGLAALASLRELGLDLPFILVSGTIGEHVAVQAMKAGAHDYILKDNLSRLVPAVERELRDAEERRQRRRAEAALRDSEQRQKLHVQQTPLAVIEWNLHFEVMAWNSSAERIFGYRSDEALGRHGAFIVAPSALPQVERLWSSLLNSKGGQRGAYQNVTREGRVIECEWYNTALVDATGQIIGVASLAQDVTERKRAEDAMQALLKGTTGVGGDFFKALVRELANALGVRACLVSAMIPGRPGRMRTLATWYQGTQMPGMEYELEGSPCATVLRESRALFVREGLDCSTLPQLPPDFRPVSYAGVPMHSTGGEAMGVVAALHSEPMVETDLARSLLTIFAARAGAELERSLAEEALRSSERDFRDLVQAVPGAVYRFRLDAHGRPSFPFLSERIVEMTGVPAGEVMLEAEALLTCLAPEVRAELRVGLERSRSQMTPWASEFPVTGRSGAARWLRGQAIPSAEPNGGTLWHGVLVDITDRKRAEEERQRLEAQLRQAQKMEAIGTLAGGIAHDFNNILAAVIPYTHLAKADAADNAAVHESLDEVLKAADRAKNLVKQILMFSRQQKQERRPMLLQPVVKEALKLIRSGLPTTIAIRAEIDPDAPPVVAEATQLHQVLMNLCTNAAHAMRERGGQLSLRLQRQDVDAHEAAQVPDLQVGAFVLLEIVDTGHGMEPEVMKRIFDPFFTTKAPGEGTGLGLSVVHGIVREHEGAIAVQSVVGQGTCFRLYLPAYLTDTEEIATVQPRTVPGRGERILFVDDEEVLCTVVKRLLERLGYSVTIQNNPLAALSLFQANPKAFDLVFTDLTMPGMTGVDLALHLLQVRPELPVILATGYGGAWTPDAARRLGIREVVLKPLDLNAFAHIVHNALHPARG